MEFTYDSYINMVRNLIAKGYCIANYENWKHNERTVILRHDVDFNLQAAAEFARLEGGGIERRTE